MIEKQMLRLMLNKTFYTKYKGSISPTIFSGDISSLFETIQKAHAKYSDNISVDELYSLHTAIFNPALTRAAKEKFSELVEDIKEVQEPSKEIAKDLRSSGFENVIVKPLKDDLKYFNTDEIREMFYDRKTNA